jgi:serine protease Do
MKQVPQRSIATHSDQTRRMNPGRGRQVWVAVVVAGLVAAACGESKTAAPASTAAAAPTTTAATTAPSTAPPTTLPTSRAGADGKLTMSDILPSIIQIQVAGSTRPVGEDASVGGARGSGFIISADGIAVTNNHVVTGASFVEVFVGGETESRPAKVLGESECDDLAVIDIEGDGFTPMQWSDVEPEPGIDVWAAGFPLGDPEPTLTKGVISKAEANGDRFWAAVASTVEHDANIQPGNSGGPLLTADGKVIAINYSGGDRPSGTAQFFAIKTSLAKPVVEKLKTGDELAIGIAPAAFVTESGIAGVWVEAVNDGSPASKAGIKAGDIITTVKGLPVGTDATMSDFCRILRSANEGTPLSVEAVRLDTNEVLSGEVWGKPLDLVGFLDTGEEPAAPAPDDADFRVVSNDAGTIAFAAPSAWEYDTAQIDLGFGEADAVLTSPFLPEFPSSDGPPKVDGIAVQVVDIAAGGGSADDLTEEFFNQWLDSIVENSQFCEASERGAIGEGITGVGQLFQPCQGGAVDNTVAFIGARPGDTKVVIVLAQATTGSSVEFLSTVLASLDY